MSPSLFGNALKFVLRWEGGYVNHPNDYGGATNKGVTQRVYSDYLRKNNLSRKDVRVITKEEVEDIYFEQYWKPIKAGTATVPLGVVLFDTAVQFGIRGATKLLQSALGLPDDGDWGRNTQKAFEAKNSKTTALAVIAERRAYRYTRVKESPSQRVFLKGWLNRDDSLEDYINGK